MPEEFPVNHLRLPDGTERIVARTEDGMLLIERTNIDIRLQYERSFPELICSDHGNSALAYLQDRRINHDRKVANELLGKIAPILRPDSDEGREDALAIDGKYDDQITFERSGSDWKFSELSSFAAGTLNLGNPPRHVLQSVMQWLHANVEGLADAREEAATKIYRQLLSEGDA